MLALALPDDLDEFEAMMAEPVERGGWIDPMDMGLSSSGGVQGCDLGVVSKELQVCKEALKRALQKNVTASPKPVQVWSVAKIRALCRSGNIGHRCFPQETRFIACAKVPDSFY